MNEMVFFSMHPAALESMIQHTVERALKAQTEQQQQPTETPDQLFSIDEAAEFLKLSKPTLYSKVSRNELPYMKRGRRLYFSRTELTEYLKEGRRQSNAEIDAKAAEYLKR